MKTHEKNSSLSKKNPDGDDLTFSITTNSGSLFEITPSGELSLASGQSLDFAVASSHTLTVQVSDGTESASSDVTVTVTEVDDNNPPVIDSNQTFSANEDIADDFVIGAVQASDPDGDDITFS